METIEKNLVVATIAFLLGACSISQQYGHSIAQVPYEIQQNSIGEFVFCDGKCPSITEKNLTVRETRLQPPKAPQAPEVTPNQTVNVFFKLGSSQLTENGKKTLNQLVPNLKNTEAIYLRGWADNRGGVNTKINRRLARNRALVVEKYLIKQGVNVPFNKTSEPPCCNNKNTRVVVVTYR